MSVLIVDDEPGIRIGVGEFLRAHRYQVIEADTWQRAEAILSSEPPDAAILDYRLPDGDALSALPRIRASHPSLPLVVLTGHGSIDLAVQAMKDGADHFLTKPVALPALLALLERLWGERRALRQAQAQQSVSRRQYVNPFLGTSAPIRTLAENARRLAAASSPVLILGETGTGKGVLARWLHEQSPRQQEPFVDINCAGLSPAFLETELFGHEKGAFTGAAATKPGLLEVADHGTVFLDEIGDVEMAVQPKLLKVLEEKRFRRLGGVRDRCVDVRLIAATHHTLALLVLDQRFRSDLYFRISTVPLTVPPLRERAEDIPLIARQLLRALGTDLGKNDVTLARDAELHLGGYHWPGNIRELKNVLERALLFCDGGELRARDLQLEPGLSASASGEDVTLATIERKHIERVLNNVGRRVSQAARQLGIPRSSLYEKIHKYHIRLSEV